MKFTPGLGGISGRWQCDTNGDGVNDSREFAGSHRYNTAVALAERFAADEGSVSTVIIASGESQVDAVTAAGLAGNLNAAVLLTRSNQLPHNVARFIDEHNVTDMVVVGGTAAVPDSIVTAIESLGSRPTVERIAGADRYATAAAIGDRLGGPNPTWCGSDQSAAILVNGGAEGRADAVVSGPMAFRLGLPILLTGADELPESTASFLTDNKVERVVVVGGMGAVSDGIVNELVEEVGVVNVQRISGGSAAATSVMVAKEILGNCAAVLSTDADRVALVNRDAIADGITAAPVLGRGLGNGSVPILLVGDELPAAVNDYLASTAEVRGGNKTHLRIVAIGGTAVVSASVMADAVAAAKTSSALTAEIKVAKNAAGTAYETWINNNATPTDTTDDAVGDGVFTVTFSDDVKLPVDGDDSDTVAGNDAAELIGTVLDPTLYRVNGRRLEALHTVDPRTAPVPTGTDRELIGYSDLVFTANRAVKIYLSHILEPNDTISVVGGVKIGASMDMRPLEAASLTLGALTVSRDRTAPRIEIIAVDGENTFDVLIHEPNLLASSNDLASATASIVRGHLSVKGSTIPANNTATPATAHTDRTVTVARASALPSASGRMGTDVMRITYDVTVAASLAQGATGTAATSTALRAGDVITVLPNAVRDKSGTGNRHTQFTVKAHQAQGTFGISSVSISDYVHSQQASATFGTGTGVLRIAALPTGVAAGAVGNDWVMYGYDDRDAATLDNNTFDIDIAVDIANKRISYTISDATPARPHRAPTIGDLASALVSNSDFAANFAVSYGGDGQTKLSALGTTAAAGVQLGTSGTEPVRGLTKVGVVVVFNDFVKTITDANRSAIAVAVSAEMFPETPADPDGLVPTFVAPDNQLHLSYTADSMLQLPKRAGFRVIPAGLATSYGTYTPEGGSETDITNIRATLFSLRPDSSIKP
ncbi:MAG: cell wall-binding repeat-containing protein [Acidimicrobiaceae bacterium]|nr:cell wall-binding repeat-containing protein [Acidimicrobiaceae bacterium]